jgi:hypothetical protein
MFRFTIRDVLWLTVVVALGVALWANQSRYRQHIATMSELVDQLKRESKVWESRAQSLRNDALTGSNKNTDVKFIPNGLRYIPKQPLTKPLESKTASGP